MVRLTLPLLTIGVALICGCRSDRQPLAGHRWVVVAIGDRQFPVGSGGQPLTMTFDDATHRLSGFAGCNQYNASYTQRGDSLSIGPAVSTQMACATGMDAEHALLGALPAISSYQLPDTILTLVGSGGVAVKLVVRQH